MIVSTQTYNILISVIALLLCVKPLYDHFIKKEEKHNLSYLFVLLLLPINWFTPTIITVTNCNQFYKEVMLFPTNRAGTSFTYGRNNYIVNKSAERLQFAHLYYGDAQPQEDRPDVTILQNNTTKVNTVTIDFIFEKPDKSVSTKSGGATKTMLYCGE